MKRVLNILLYGGIAVGLLAYIAINAGFGPGGGEGRKFHELDDTVRLTFAEREAEGWLIRCYNTADACLARLAMICGDAVAAVSDADAISDDGFSAWHNSFKHSENGPTLQIEATCA